jgi:hypothetical protein
MNLSTERRLQALENRLAPRRVRPEYLSVAHVDDIEAARLAAGLEPGDIVKLYIGVSPDDWPEKVTP